MKRFLVFSEHLDGQMNRWEVFADSEEEAEAKVKGMFSEPISAKAFDWHIQFRCM